MRIGNEAIIAMTNTDFMPASCFCGFSKTCFNLIVIYSVCFNSFGPLLANALRAVELVGELGISAFKLVSCLLFLQACQYGITRTTACQRSVFQEQYAISPTLSGVSHMCSR